MPNYSFNVIWSEEDDAYIATCPAFPDLSAFGETLEEALEEVRVVLDLFIEEYEADGVPLPEPTTLWMLRAEGGNGGDGGSGGSGGGSGPPPNGD